MEGIITGIGDKELGKNLIKPEYDAIINDFIISKNTILEGLVLNGKNISAGTCVLRGYRGIIDTPKELDTTAYVYGEFTLGSIYGGSGEDDFNIVTSDTALNEIEYIVNPTEITSAGTYYLLLYENGIEKIDREHSYPKYSQYSVETKNVLDDAVIAPTATTPTETKTITNELGEQETVIVTDLHLPTAQPKRVANTEYVHAQIEREMDYKKISEKLYNSALGIEVGDYIAIRKSRFVILQIYVYHNYGLGDEFKFLPDDFLPTKTIYFGIPLRGSFNLYSIDTNGKVTLIGGSTTSPGDETLGKYISIGYECQKGE